jgi:hypothetical protein
LQQRHSAYRPRLSDVLRDTSHLGGGPSVRSIRIASTPLGFTHCVRPRRAHWCFGRSREYRSLTPVLDVSGLVMASTATNRGGQDPNCDAEPAPKTHRRVGPERARHYCPAPHTIRQLGTEHDCSERLQTLQLHRSPYS